MQCIMCKAHSFAGSNGVPICKVIVQSTAGKYVRCELRCERRATCRWLATFSRVRPSTFIRSRIRFGTASAQRRGAARQLPCEAIACTRTQIRHTDIL